MVPSVGRSAPSAICVVVAAYDAAAASNANHGSIWGLGQGNEGGKERVSSGEG